MNLLKQLERKLGRFAIHDLTLYLVGGQGLALLIGLTVPGFVGNMLLVPDAVLAGQWWRLISFLITPPSGNPIFAVFTLYFLYFMGGALEAHWGTFRYNVYVLIGFLLTIAAAFAFPFYAASNVYITGSIFLAFAFLFPDYEILLFLILPVRVKWLALLTWLFYGYDFLTGGGPARLLILAAVANFLLFFGQDLFLRVRYGHRKVKRQAKAVADRDKPIHVCTVCGVTDKSNRTMEFRYCTKCDPPVAYCMDHLNDHQHLRSGDDPARSGF
jgi:hypothetical protein